MATATLSIRIDSDLKKRAEDMFADMGLNTSTAVNMFIHQVVRLGKIPFEVAADVSNKETLEAIDDVNNNKNLSKAYDDMDELMRDLNA